MNDKANEFVNKLVDILVVNYKKQNVPQYLLAHIDEAMFDAEDYILSKYNLPRPRRYEMWETLYDAITDKFIIQVS